MNYVAFDTETHLIRPGLLSPRMVCLSFAYRSGEAIHSGLVDRVDGIRMIRNWLLDDEFTLVAHNGWFDYGVLAAADPSLIPLIFDKLEKGLIEDTIIRMQLIDICQGELKFHYDEDTGDMIRSSYTLADLSYRLNKKFIKKGGDTWRLKYALLDGVSIVDWPAEAVKYAVLDAETTLEVFEAQEKMAGGPIPNSAEQHRAAWALHLMSMWGIRTDAEMVGRLKEELQKDYAEALDVLRPSGLLKIQPARVNRKGEHVPEKISKSMRDIMARVEKCLTDKGVEIPQTDGGKTSTSRKTLLATGDPELKQLAESGFIAKLLSTYLPVLESGARLPINPRYNVLVETGRTSCSRPNIQNPPRKGGVRECFVARPGWVYVFCDYDTLELRSLAQVCLDKFGNSEMAEALRRGEDLHLKLAAQMLGVDYATAKKRFDDGDPELAEYRQQAKPANFGYPGGMAAHSFKEYAEGYGIHLSEERAKEIRDIWFDTFPEMESYFALIESLSRGDEPVEQVRSGRLRGGASFCALANGFFQGLAADGAKEALWQVAKECYTVPSSPLYGSRPVYFIHDEIGMETPWDPKNPMKAAAAAKRLSDVMVESMKKWIPDIPISCGPVMVRRWFKGAKPVNDNGVLLPSKPQKVEANGKTKTVWVKDV